jgi:hypothetical protein
MSLKAFLIIVAKNAVNAILTNSALLALWHTQVNFTHNGLVNMLRVAAGCVGAREVLVWGPIVLKWSSTNADPNALDIASVEAGRAVAHAQKAQEAISEAKAADPESKS